MAMDYRAIRDYGDIMEDEDIACMFWGDTYEPYWEKLEVFERVDFDSLFTNNS